MNKMELEKNLKTVSVTHEKRQEPNKNCNAAIYVKRGKEMLQIIQ